MWQAGALREGTLPSPSPSRPSRGVRIDVEELDRMRIPLEEGLLSWEHENSTLIIQYKKPAQVVQKERDAKVARLTAPELQPGAAGAEGGDPAECKQQ